MTIDLNKAINKRTNFDSVMFDFVDHMSIQNKSSCGPENNDAKAGALRSPTK